MAESVLLLGIEIIVLIQSNLEFKQFLGVGKKLQNETLGRYFMKNAEFSLLLEVGIGSGRRPAASVSPTAEAAGSWTAPNLAVRTRRPGIQTKPLRAQWKDVQDTNHSGGAVLPLT